ncbi:MAG: GNAT family N-acetyltransferase [candidate division Zixibacteria bacterium]|nr:GNAT family N-acetyltransferase [candidate division Zixibacteria bacterium]
MKVVRCPVSTLDFNDIIDMTPDTFFASPGFANLWRTVGGEPVYWVVQADDDEIIAFLPGIEFGMKWFRRFQSMPDGCYGGLFLSPDKRKERNIIAEQIMSTLANAGYIKVFLTDFYKCLDQHSSFQYDEYKTTLVKITRPAWEPPDKKLRQQIRKAAREGIEVQRFDPDRNFESFLKLMEQTEKRHNRKQKYPMRFFRGLAELAATDDRVHWVWCESNGQPAASHIFIIERDMLISWQTYFDKAFSWLKPNQYILYKTAVDLTKRGIKYLNLGASPPDAVDLQAYKGRWGGEIRTYPCYSCRKGLGKLF